MKTKPLRQELGEECRKLRKTARLSQQALANTLNQLNLGFSFHREDISAFERTGEKVGLEKIEAIFGYFNKTLVLSEKKTANFLNKGSRDGRNKTNIKFEAHSLRQESATARQRTRKPDREPVSQD